MASALVSMPTTSAPFSSYQGMKALVVLVAIFLPFRFSGPLMLSSSARTTTRRAS